MEDIQHKVAALSCFNDPQDVTALAGGLTMSTFWSMTVGANMWCGLVMIFHNMV